MSSPFNPPNQAEWPHGEHLLARLYPNGLTPEMIPLFWRLLVAKLGRPQATAFARWHLGIRFREPSTLHALNLAERKLLSEMTNTLQGGAFFAWVKGEPLEPPTQQTPSSTWHRKAVGQIRRAFPEELSEEQAASLLRIVGSEMSFRSAAELTASVTHVSYIDWLHEAYGDERMDPIRDQAVYDRLEAAGFIDWFTQND